MRVASLPLVGLILSCLATGAAAQAPVVEPPRDPYSHFPMILTLEITDRIYPYRADIEARIRSAAPSLVRPGGVSSLVDSLIARWDHYGDAMVLDHGDFHEMSRGRAYWLITTDDAADTLTDRLGRVLETYIKTHPSEVLSPVRVEWETGTAKLGVPTSRIFGFQFIELARRGGVLRDQLLATRPESAEIIYDAYVRFLWDLTQFYRQLHGTWYDRHTMRVAQEDWIIHRLVSRCKEPGWKLLFSLTAIGVDTLNSDPMKDRFMHRIVVANPDCPDTADFVVFLPHYRLMEQELNAKSDAEKREIFDRLMKEGKRQNYSEPLDKAKPPTSPPANRPTPQKGVDPR